ncbi:MAG: glycosyltransferase family 2 protein [Acidobacteria bacterium]|nr:glycosyltransferase family 2 protein [Acidobacteriota bacterium]
MTCFQNVSIVIPNWNGEKLLIEFLPSVLQAANYYQEKYNALVEIIIVDDGSQDNSVNYLETNYKAQIKLIVLGKNQGFAKATNQGFLAAKYPIIFLLNNDIRVEIDAIAPLVKHFNDDLSVFAVCSKAYRLESDLFDGAGKLGNFHKGHWHIFINYDVFSLKLPNPDTKLYSFIASGGYSAFDRVKLLEIGGFCELLSPFYWEDAELCYRAWKRGWKIYYEPKSVVYHRSSATIGKKVPSRQVQIIAERNRLLMHWINLHNPTWLISHILWIILKLLQAVIRLDIAYWQTVYNALRLLPQALVLRKKEKLAQVVSDKEITEIFSKQAKENWVMVINDPSDYYRYVKLSKDKGKPTGLPIQR